VNGGDKQIVLPWNCVNDYTDQYYRILCNGVEIKGMRNLNTKSYSDTEN